LIRKTLSAASLIPTIHYTIVVIGICSLPTAGWMMSLPSGMVATKDFATAETIYLAGYKHLYFETSTQLSSNCSIKA
jgi:hypothetical protein